MKCGCYINSAARSGELSREFKDLVPSPDIRRRMSNVVKMGVGAAMDAIGRLPEGQRINAILTATELGCLSDSEKFLDTFISTDERLLNPTPFIQSTFNVVGGVVALLTGNHCYNVTYSDNGGSFGAALLDAVIQLQRLGGNVLVAAFDERTPTLETISARTGLACMENYAEGGWAFVLSDRPMEGCLARLEAVEWTGHEAAVDIHPALLMYEALRELENGPEQIKLRSKYMGSKPIEITLGCI